MFHLFDINLGTFLYLEWVDENDEKDIFKDNCFVKSILLVEVAILFSHGASNFFFS